MTYASAIDKDAITVQLRVMEVNYEQVTVDDVNAAVMKWNDVRSILNTDTPLVASCNWSSSGYTGDITIESINITAGLLGITDFYVYNSGTGVYSAVANPESSSASISQIRIALAPLLAKSEKKLITRVITHEMGHALLLRHPLEYGCSTTCLMLQTSTDYMSYDIESHDKKCLKNKWRN